MAAYLVKKALNGLLLCGEKKEAAAAIGLADEVTQRFAGIPGKIPVYCSNDMVIDKLLDDFPCHAGTQDEKCVSNNMFVYRNPVYAGFVL